MKVITLPSDMQHELANFRQDQIALVPTMGCLHEGHVSLIRQAKRLADVVVVSIYVNPLQFAQGEDLDTYPQPFADDAALCEAEGVDFIFHPQNLSPDTGLQVHLGVGDLSNKLCGASRQGHFDGVVTVVNILFNIIQPHIAIFGEKDYQQLSILRRMVSDLHMPIDIIEGATVRQEDGLAKSSRNRYLDDTQRQQAAHLFTALQLMQAHALHSNPLEETLKLGKQHLQEHHIQTEYLNICDESTLEPLQTLQNNDAARIFVAARIGKTRLIDNMPLCPSSPTEDNTPCA